MLSCKSQIVFITTLLRILLLLIFFLCGPLKQVRATEQAVPPDRIPVAAQIKFYQSYGIEWGDAPLEQKVRFMKYYNQWKEQAAKEEKEYEVRQENLDKKRAKELEEKEKIIKRLEDREKELQKKERKKEQERLRQKRKLERQQRRLKEMQKKFESWRK